MPLSTPSPPKSEKKAKGKYMAKQKSRYYKANYGLSTALNIEGARLFQDAITRFGPAWEGGCLCTLIRGRLRWEDGIFSSDGNKHLGGQLCHPMGFFDHATFFQRPRAPVAAVVGQPYDYRDDKDGPILRDFCVHHNLRMEIGRSWHYPGHATALIFTR